MLYRPGFLLLLIVTSVAYAEPKESTNWPQFHGPNALGVANGYDTPVKFNVETGENILWKTPIPGLGYSAPAIWGNKVFITTSVNTDKENPDVKVGLYGDIQPVDESTAHSYRLYCLNKKTGEIQWEKEAYKGVPKIKRHPKGSHANCTPATDGKHVVVFFGSEGLYCYNMKGKLLWNQDLGVLDSGYFEVPEAQWGFASSPIIHGNKVIVQCDIQKNSFLAAFNVENGEQIWMTMRDEVPTWGTPTVHVSEKRSQVICNGWKRIAGYDLETGKELWVLRGGGDIPVPTPIVAHDLIYITNAHGGMAPMYAIKTSAKGKIKLSGNDAKSPHVEWWSPRNGNYMQTPIVIGDLLFGCMDNGVVTCFNAKTGEVYYRERLAGGKGFTASGVAANDKIYYTSEEGDVYVIKASKTFEKLAQNSLGENCLATPAISKGVLFFHGQHHVIAVGNKE